MLHLHLKLVKKGVKGGVVRILFFILSSSLFAQDVSHSVISDNVINDNDHMFRIYDMVIDTSENKRIKSAYVVKNAYEKFQQLKANNNILLVASASYSSSIYDSIANPVGFCSEKGFILNKMPSTSMDGLVMLNPESDTKTIEVIDLEADVKTCHVRPCDSHPTHYNIRENPSDTYHFMEFVKQKHVSAFQTHLLYSYHKPYDENFADLYQGTSDRGRRFLVMCQKDNELHYLVVDHMSGDYLMQAAKRSYDYITSQDYTIQYVLNLDTGNKDILHAFNGSRLENMRPNPRLRSATLEQAVSLVVFYTEKQNQHR